MKTLTNLYVNGDHQDTVIEHFAKEYMTPDNKIEWVDEKNFIAKCHGDARNITIYIKDYEDNRKITSITISAKSIKELYKLITEIESKTSEEFID